MNFKRRIEMIRFDLIPQTRNRTAREHSLMPNVDISENKDN